MSTLASLASMLGQMPQIRPWDVAQRSVNEAETGLLTLADLKNKQVAEQEMLLAIKQNPALAQQLFGGSVLGSLGQAPPGPGGMPAPAPAPMTQQTVMPGQPLGAPQTVPGGQDLSRFANVPPTGGGPIPPNVMGQVMPQVTPPPGTPTLATLGQGQGGMPGQGAPQGQQNPLLAMAAKDPRAALMLQQQMQGQEDRQLKQQEQRLKISTTILESLGRRAQGTTDQASWDLFRQDAASIDPRMAAQLPQVYSKEARDRVVAQALEVKDAMTLQAAELTAQAAVIKARKEGRSTDVDNQLRAMGVQPGQETPAQMKEALQNIQQGKVDVSAAQGRGAAEIERTEKPLEGAAATSVSNLTLLRTMTDDIAALRTDAFTGPVVGRTGFVREQAGKMSQEETAFRRTVTDVQDILGRLRSGAAIPAPEMSRLEGLAPSVNDPPEVFKAKLQSFQRAVEQNRESITRVGTTGRQQLREETTPTTPRVGEKPTTQGSTGAGGQAPATSQGPATFDRADFLKWRQGSGKSGNPTQADVEAYFQAKGLKRR